MFLNDFITNLSSGVISSDESIKNTIDPTQILLQLQLILESANNGIVAINKEGIIIAYNSAAEKIIGMKKEKVLGQYIKAMDKSEGLMEIVKTGQAQKTKKYHLNGRTILTNRAPLMKNNELLGAVAVFQDISEVEAISQELEVTKQLLEEINAILEASYDGIFITDKNGKVLNVNTSWENICGIPRAKVIDRTTKELVEAGLYTKSAAQMAIDTGKPSTVMLNMTDGPNKGKRIMATGTPIYNNGELTRVVTNVRDITELENLKCRLEKSRELAEKYSNEIKEIRRQQQNFSDLIFQSKEMENIMELVSRAAAVDSTVLITGESGVGKEVIAGYLHKFSFRSQGPLIKINCGAIPHELLESELFGYEPGAFTGAMKNGKIGLFELANEGTILLDEIGEMPLDLQVKLLRALQQKEITRVGGVKPRKIDVRIVAATNRNLKQMMQEGKFRQDLYYRLNVINIYIPALRERKIDIPPLIHHFLKKYNKKHRRNKVLTPQVINVLTDYHWPGNIRELENLIESLVVLVEEQEIHFHHLPDSYSNTNAASEQIFIQGIIPLKRAIELVEKELILKAKQQYGSTRKIAKVLGVNQSTVVRKLKEIN